jgi:hypothetical protein
MMMGSAESVNGQDRGAASTCKKKPGSNEPGFKVLAT